MIEIAGLLLAVVVGLVVDLGALALLERREALRLVAVAERQTGRPLRPSELAQLFSLYDRGYLARLDAHVVALGGPPWWLFPRSPRLQALGWPCWWWRTAVRTSKTHGALLALTTLSRRTELTWGVP